MPVHKNKATNKNSYVLIIVKKYGSGKESFVKRVNFDRWIETKKKHDQKQAENRKQQKKINWKEFIRAVKSLVSVIESASTLQSDRRWLIINTRQTRSAFSVESSLRGTSRYMNSWYLLVYKCSFSDVNIRLKCLRNRDIIRIWPFRKQYIFKKKCVCLYMYICQR